MYYILDQKIGDVRQSNEEYQSFEARGVNESGAKRLVELTPQRILGLTVKQSINEIIIGHSKTPRICLAPHERVDTKFDAASCTNKTHACYHGESTIIPGMLVGSFLIEKITGSLPFEHPGTLLHLMRATDLSAQRHYGTGTEEDYYRVWGLPPEIYARKCHEVIPIIEREQRSLYQEHTYPRTEAFIKAVRECLIPVNK